MPAETPKRTIKKIPNLVRDFVSYKSTLEALTGKTGVTLKSITNSPASVGSTQSRGYMVELSDGSKWFLREKRSLKSQQTAADIYIRAVLGDYTEQSPFVFSKVNQGTIDIFPLAEGKLVYNFLENRGTQEEQDACDLSLGQALGQIHVQGLNNNNSMQALEENKGRLSAGMGVLVHPDFQTSNIIYNTQSHTIHFIDTEGIETSDKEDPYKNISEALENFKGDSRRQKLLLSGYLAAYPEKNQEQVLDSLFSSLREKYPKVMLDDSARPDVPVRWEDIKPKGGSQEDLQILNNVRKELNPPENASIEIHGDSIQISIAHMGKRSEFNTKIQTHPLGPHITKEGAVFSIPKSYFTGEALDQTQARRQKSNSGAVKRPPQESQEPKKPPVTPPKSQRRATKTPETKTMKYEAVPPTAQVQTEKPAVASQESTVKQQASASETVQVTKTQPEEKKAPIQEPDLTAQVELSSLEKYDPKKPQPLKQYDRKRPIENKDGKLLYELEVGDAKLFWKKAKTNEAHFTVEDTREVAGANIANYVTQGLVPRAHLRLVDGKKGIGQEMIQFQVFEGANDPKLDDLTPKQVAQILAHLIADKMCSNLDCHYDQFGIDSQGNIVGIDKGEAFKHFRRGKVGFGDQDSDSFMNYFEGKQAKDFFYPAIARKIQEGTLKVDFNDPIIQEALNRCSSLSRKDVEKLYSPYAEVRWESNPDDFYQQAHERAQVLKQEFEKLTDYLKSPPPELDADDVKVESVLDKLTVPLDLTEQKVAQAQAEGDQLRQQNAIEKLAEKEATEKERYTQLNQAVKDIKIQMGDLQMMHTDLSRTISMKSQEFSKIEGTIDFLKSQPQLSSQLQQLQKQLQTLKEEQSRLEEKRDKVVQALDKLGGELSTLEQQSQFQLKIRNAYQKQSALDAQKRARHGEKTPPSSEGTTPERKDSLQPLELTPLERFRYLTYEQYDNLARFFHQPLGDDYSRPDVDFLLSAAEIVPYLLNYDSPEPEESKGVKITFPRDLTNVVQGMYNSGVSYETLMDIAQGRIQREEGRQLPYSTSEMKSHESKFASKHNTREYYQKFAQQQTLHKKVIDIQAAARALHQSVEKNEDTSQLRMRVDKLNNAFKEYEQLEQKFEGAELGIPYSKAFKNAQTLQHEVHQKLDHETVQGLEQKLTSLKSEVDELAEMSLDKMSPSDIATVKRQLDRHANAFHKAKLYTDDPQLKQKVDQAQQEYEAQVQAFQEIQTNHQAHQQQVAQQAEQEKAQRRESVKNKVAQLSNLDRTNPLHELMIENITESVLEAFEPGSDLDSLLTLEALHSLVQQQPLPQAGVQPATRTQPPSYPASMPKTATGGGGPQPLNQSQQEALERLKDMEGHLDERYRRARYGTGKGLLKRFIGKERSSRAIMVESLDNALKDFVSDPQKNRENMKAVIAMIKQGLESEQKDSSYKLGESGMAKLVAEIEELVKQATPSDQPKSSMAHEAVGPTSPQSEVPEETHGESLKSNPVDDSPPAPPSAEAPPAPPPPPPNWKKKR